MDSARLRRRIKARLEELGRGAVEAAERVGLERNYINDFLKEKKKSIKIDTYPKIAAALEWTVAELTATRDVVPPTGDQSTQVSVPEYDLRAGAAYGGGLVSEEYTTDETGGSVLVEGVRFAWGLPRPFLQDELGIRPGRAHILPIRGDSMVDVLYDGDRAIIDLDDTDISQGGIFAVRDDNGSIVIKQVELIRGKSGQKRIRCTSRNSHYTPFDLILADPVAIIGRVACKLTRV